MSVHAHLGVFQTAERLFSLQERLEYFLLVWDGNVRTDRVEILQEEMTRLGDDILDLAQTLNWENFRVHAAAMANALRACRIAVQSFFSGSRVPDCGSTASDFADVDVLPEWTSSDRRRHFEAARLTVTQLLGSVIQLTPGLKLSLPPYLQPFFEICRLTFPAVCQIDEISGLSTDERHHRLLNEVRPGLIRELRLCASIQPGLVNIRIGPLVLQRSEGDLHDFRRHMESCLNELCTGTLQPHERALPRPQMRLPVSEQQSEASTVCGILRHGGEPALLVTATQTVSDNPGYLRADEGADLAETAGVISTFLPNGGIYLTITHQASARCDEPTTISTMTNTANGNELPESAGAVERHVADPIVNPAPNAVDQLPTDGGENNGGPSGNEPLVLSGAAGRNIEDARVPVSTGERSGAEAEAFPNADVPPELVSAADGLIADPAVDAGRHLQPESTESPGANDVDRSAATSEKLRDGFAPSDVGLTLTKTQNAVFTLLFHATDPLTIDELVAEVNTSRERTKTGRRKAPIEKNNAMHKHLQAIRDAFKSKFPQCECSLLNGPKRRGERGKYSLNWVILRELLRGAQACEAYDSVAAPNDSHPKAT